MPTLKITGWKPGLKKISMTTTLKDRLGIGLKNAKQCTDDVLDDKVVSFYTENIAEATALRDELIELGAIVEITKD